ncbi:MAG: group II intron reverse transcriptase/maturase [Gammaproteobacteria bacterium]|nr:group II intron reverse transcriptase/maturase [Gammaproteobacteria bacterium]
MMAEAAEGPIKSALGAKQGGQNPTSAASEAASVTVVRGYAHEEPTELMSAVLDRPNMQRAYARVLRNKGAPGVDGMEVTDLGDHLKAHWSVHKQELLEGVYRPQPVRKVEIPKPGGGKRQLGIPTALDRLIQQALRQVLSPVFEPGFSESSYGFRPGRNAGQAVQQAREYVEAGHHWAVDIDLEAFFDRVNHDMLMARVARQVKDKRVLKLIRAYLESGVCEGGLVTARREGTPQGGPISPLLSNILLTDLDRELEKRGHKFCRYADDCNIYVKSEKAGQRVLESITQYLEKKLKLRVNREKSGVDQASKRKFLGYTVYHWKDAVHLKVAPAALKRLKGDLRAVFRRGRGRSLGRIIEELNPKLRGWIVYYRHSRGIRVLRELDSWIRRHLRQILWLQWKRAFTRAKNLMRLGLCEKRAWNTAQNGRGSWWNAGSQYLNRALPVRLFARIGLISLVSYYHQLNRLT